MKMLNQAIATVGIWIGVGLCGITGKNVSWVAFFAMWATLAIWIN